MSDLAHPARSSRVEPAAWVAVALLCGLLVGWMVSRGSASVADVVLVAAGAVVALLTFRRLEFGLLLMLFVLPLDSYGRIISQPVAITAFHVVLLICLLAWSRKLLTGRAHLHFSWVDAGVLAFIGAGLWSLPTSLAPSATAVAVFRIGFLWLLALLYANGVENEAQLRRLLVALAVTGVLLSAVGLAQYFVPGFDLGSIRDVLRAGGAVSFSRVGAFFFDPNYFAGLLSALTPMCLAFLVHARSRRAAVAWGLAAAATGLTLILTFSRGGWVGGAVGLVVVVVTAPRRRRAWMAGALVAIALVAAVSAPATIVSRFTSISNVETDVSVATRYYMTASMQDMIAARPVFGTGLGAFDKAYPSFRRPGTSFDIVKPHQIPLAFIAETGVAGAIAEIILVGGLIAIYWRKRPEGWDVLEAAVLVGVVTLLVGTLFEYYLYFEYLWLFLGLSPVVMRIVRAKPRRKPVEI
jgi:putative inorganic carbon (hco3(-)) transporter